MQNQKTCNYRRKKKKEFTVWVKRILLEMRPKGQFM